MAAAPYKGRVVLKNLRTGEIQSENVYGPDVNADYVQWYSMGQQDWIRSKVKDAYITDVTLSAAGTDTSQIRIYVNGKDSGIRLIKAGLVATVNNRIQDPIGPIQAGSIIMMEELT
jgi:hypothetical protein